MRWKWIVGIIGSLVVALIVISYYYSVDFLVDKINGIQYDDLE
jgi:hypothetical protein